MKITALNHDQKVCPICLKNNSCGNDRSKPCWCGDPTIAFPEELLGKVPDHLRGKACICRNCALLHSEQKNQLSAG